MTNGDGALEVIDDPRTGQQGLRLTRGVAAGEVVVGFAVASRHGAPARMTMQVSEGEHVRFDPPWLALTNHACEPNAVFDVVGGVVVALRAIDAGEDLTCFYPATEWAMAEPFACRCGSVQCVGEVRGASAMDDAVLAGKVLAPHIKRMLGAARRLQSQ
jgi:hypothetical protein